MSTIFELTEPQRLIRDAVRRFAEAELGPGARRTDDAEVFPLDLVPGLAALGLFGLFVDADLGGAGLDLASGALALEEVARFDAGVALALAAHNARVLGPLTEAQGSSQTRSEARTTASRIVAELTAGERLGAYVALEGAGFEGLSAGSGWIVDGASPRVPLGAVARTLLVVALPQGTASVPRVFALDRDTAGIAAAPLPAQLGLRSAGTAAITFDRVVVPASALLEVGPALAGVEARLRVLLGAIGAGIARAALEVARQYALERQQFGKAIADFQAIQWMLADMATETEAARLLVRGAAARIDAGLPANREASQAKLFAAEVAERAAMKAIQIHGGYGFTRDFPVERCLRDAKVLAAAEAPSDGERTQIARSVLER